MKGNSFGGRNSGGPYGGECDPSGSDLVNKDQNSLTVHTSLTVQTVGGYSSGGSGGGYSSRRY